MSNLDNSNSPSNYNNGYYNIGSMILIGCCMVSSWIFIQRWGQRNKVGPKTWPLIGAAVEQLMNFDNMHDWLVEYLSKSKTVVVPMPFTTYTYIADPANVEHVLKTNFANYPKVTYYSSLNLLHLMVFKIMLVEIG